MNRLVLIDGNAILHRAYHALPPLTAPDGSIVNAVYGFTSMLFKIINDFQPQYLSVTFDRAAPTFRKKLFASYQAKRPKMDDDLIPQIEKVHEMLKSFEVAIYEKDGYEADDIIGTLCQKINNKTKIDQVIIVTGDRDILQLVKDDKVLVFMPTKGLSEGKLYGEKEVLERLGVSPDKIPDYKALAGDQSDNYPGVPGVGPKTAAELLQKFGSVDKVLAAAKSKSSKIKDTLVFKLQEGRESAQMSHKLATIKKNVPIDIDWQKMTEFGLNKPQAREYLEGLHFFSLLKRLDKNQVANIKLEKQKVKENKSADKIEDNQQSLF